ncbi:hypothetical protein [Halocatena salina]|uniref:Uncharacterized protein n=1 Tax=Halocatena salina TaxID=2934340 RepID=A0A8U0A7G2_9EURY|nr:hypothetical protein [Halocatena salina]UPM43943.1 hypothetical protein MW046_05740 [Halocatena salina]
MIGVVYRCHPDRSGRIFHRARLGPTIGTPAAVVIPMLIVNLVGLM